MADMNKVLMALECWGKRTPCKYEKCPYHANTINVLPCQEAFCLDAMEILKAQDEIISELLKVGYPHGYENEEPWIKDYMQLITEVVRKAVHLRNGTD